MAEGVFRSLTKSNPRIGEVDSAGTHADTYHDGDAPDHRTMETLKRNGISDYDHSSRGVLDRDFDNFDYIFAMDASNMSDLRRKRRRRGSQGKAQVMLFGTYNGKTTAEQVGDPYYGADSGFDQVYEQVVRFSKNFLKAEIDKDASK